MPRSEVLPQISPARPAGCCPATLGDGSRVVHIWGRKTRHPVCHVTCGSCPVLPAPPTPGGSGCGTFMEDRTYELGGLWTTRRRILDLLMRWHLTPCVSLGMC